MNDYSNFKCKFILKEKIWSIADDFRRQHWPSGELPLDIEKIIETELKIDIIPEHGIHEYAKIDT